MFGLFGNKTSLLLRNKATDPVCKMKVDKNSQYFSEYKGEKYHFCSESCKNQFGAKPEDFVKKNTAASCCH